MLGAKEPSSDKGRYEDKGTVEHRRRMELFDKVIAKYTATTGPLLEEEKKEVEKLLEEAREMPIPQQVTHQECEVPKIESGDEAGSEDDEELDPTDARKYRTIATRLKYLAVDRVDIQFAVK